MCPNLLGIDGNSPFSCCSDFNASLPYLWTDEPSAFTLPHVPHAGVYNLSLIHFIQLTSWYVGVGPFLSGSFIAPDTSYMSPGLRVAIDVPNFVTSSTSTAATPPFDDVSSVFKCHWLNCAEAIAPSDSLALKERILVHFKEVHPAALDKTPMPKTCQWRGCVCQTTRNGRCMEQLPDHSAHAQDVLTHIYRIHTKRREVPTSVS
jgi:hypothetical protein